MNDTIRVFGSYGDMDINRNTGKIVNFFNHDCLSDDEREPSYNGLRILQFDLDEYRHYWGRKSGELDTDILCIGFWYLDDNDVERYEPAVDEYRQIVRNGRGDFPPGAVAWIFANRKDEADGARWIFDRNEALVIERENPGRVEWHYFEAPVAACQYSMRRFS